MANNPIQSNVKKPLNFLTYNNQTREIDMNHSYLSIFAIMVTMIAGCASTGVIPMDQDSYMIGKKDGSPGIGVSLTNKAEVYKEANAFCKAKGLEVLTLRVDTTPSMPARLGSTELQFKCVPPGGTAQPLVKDADHTIEIRNR